MSTHASLSPTDLRPNYPQATSSVGSATCRAVCRAIPISWCAPRRCFSGLLSPGLTLAHARRPKTPSDRAYAVYCAQSEVNSAPHWWDEDKPFDQYQSNYDRCGSVVASLLPFSRPLLPRHDSAA